MKRLRVLLLITNLGKGGAQRVFHDHALAFSAVHDVEEAVFDMQQDQRIYDTALPLHDLCRSSWLAKFGPIGRLLSRAVALRALVAARGFDVVISHMDGANWVNVLSFSAAKKVLVVHGTVLRDANVPAVQQWFRRHLIFPWLYNLAQSTVAVSTGIARELSFNCGVKNAHAIPNFFELEAIRLKSKEALDKQQAPIFEHPAVLITSGRLAEQKKQTHLLDMLAALHRRGVRARLVILGDGELRATLVTRSRELGFRTFQVWEPVPKILDDGDVYFLGYVSNPYQYLARSTLFLFPSGWEGFPLALCEAMIASVPVLSADCPTGPREILAPDTIRDTYDLRQAEVAQSGVLLPMLESSQDLEIWVEAVERLLADAGQREKLKEYASLAVKALDRDVVVGQWLALIERVAHA
jgi:glycosyltransferase involved in cell wall biosynthesis